MVSRREVLFSLSAAPLFASASYSRSALPIQVYEESHPLAAESAAGYRSVFSSLKLERGGVIIVPAMREMSVGSASGLAEGVRSGANLWIESGLCFSSEGEVGQQLAILRNAFGLEVLRPVRTAGNPYVRYVLPCQKLVRTFEAVNPVASDDVEVLARFQQHVVCVRKKLGSGSIIYLGSMIGSGLLADEREAHSVVRELLRFA